MDLFPEVSNKVEIVIKNTEERQSTLQIRNQWVKLVKKKLDEFMEDGHLNLMCCSWIDFYVYYYYYVLLFKMPN